MKAKQTHYMMSGVRRNHPEKRRRTDVKRNSEKASRSTAQLWRGKRAKADDLDAGRDDDKEQRRDSASITQKGSRGVRYKNCIQEKENNTNFLQQVKEDQWTHQKRKGMNNGKRTTNGRK
jgi:hypothetical protein